MDVGIEWHVGVVYYNFINVILRKFMLCGNIHGIVYYKIEILVFR